MLYFSDWDDVNSMEALSLYWMTKEVWNGMTPDQRQDWLADIFDHKEYDEDYYDEDYSVGFAGCYI